MKEHIMKENKKESSNKHKWRNENERNNGTRMDGRYRMPYM